MGLPQHRGHAKKGFPLKQLQKGLHSNQTPQMTQVHFVPGISTTRLGFADCVRVGPFSVEIACLIHRIRLSNEIGEPAISKLRRFGLSSEMLGE